MKHSAIPWILAGLMALYVYGLTDHAKNSPQPDPSYDFYDTTCVTIHVKGSKEHHDVNGQFNNILEGRRQLTSATFIKPDKYKLTFKVNSPRPAMLYVDDEVMKIFLVPGDTSLSISMRYIPATFQIDSLKFEGKTANICEYFQEKTTKFGGVHIRTLRNTIAADNFEGYGSQLDLFAAKELGFLAEKEILFDLPEWFVHFEKNEILYQKAYLKLSRAFNQNVPDDFLDNIAPYNEEAVLSYYYYLYLNVYLSHLAEGVEENPSPKSALHTHLSIADTLLKQGPHDVFMTRAIFDQLAQDQIDFAESLFDKFEDSFFSKKYVRFLRTQIEQRKDPS